MRRLLVRFRHRAQKWLCGGTLDTAVLRSAGQLAMRVGIPPELLYNGQLTQLVRVPPLQDGSRKFESYIAHKFNYNR